MVFWHYEDGSRGLGKGYMQPYSVHEEIKTVDDLLALHDDRFIIALYRRLLGREPDSIGHAGYLRSLRRGDAKLALVRDIVTSDEGRSKLIDLGGLDKAMKRYEDRTRSLFTRWRFRNSADYGRSKRARDARAQINQVFGFEDRVSARLENIERMLDGIVDAVRMGAFLPVGESGPTTAKQAEAIHAIHSRGLSVRSSDLPGKDNRTIAQLKI
jgi:hypothetical protein